MEGSPQVGRARRAALTLTGSASGCGVSVPGQRKSWGERSLRFAKEATRSMIVILMGVAGSGKSTVGELLAMALGWGFVDADSFHPR